MLRCRSSTHDGTECDLLLTHNDKPVGCIETKITTAPKITRSLTISINDLGTAKNFIIIQKCNKSFFLIEKIRVCNIVDFVSHHLPLLAQ